MFFLSLLESLYCLGIDLDFLGGFRLATINIYLALNGFNFALPFSIQKISIPSLTAKRYSFYKR